MKTIIVSISMLAMTFGLMAGEAHNHDAAAKGKAACCDKAQTAAKAGSCDKAQTAAKAACCDKAKTAGKACDTKSADAKRATGLGTKGGQLLISSL